MCNAIYFKCYEFSEHYCFRKRSSKFNKTCLVCSSLQCVRTSSVLQCPFNIMCVSWNLVFTTICPLITMRDPLVWAKASISIYNGQPTFTLNDSRLCRAINLSCQLLPMRTHLQQRETNPNYKNKTNKHCDERLYLPPCSTFRRPLATSSPFCDTLVCPTSTYTQFEPCLI